MSRDCADLPHFELELMQNTTAFACKRGVYLTVNRGQINLP